jgi:hypothetical protein
MSEWGVEAWASRWSRDLVTGNESLTRSLRYWQGDKTLPLRTHNDGWKGKEVYMNDASPKKQRRGRIGAGILLWLLGVPLPIIIIIFLLMGGC